MKKTLTLLTLLLSLSLTLSACGNKKETNAIEEKLNEIKHIDENYSEDINTEIDKNISNEDIKEAHILFLTEYIACLDFTINDTFPIDGIIADEDYNKYRKQAEDLLEKAYNDIVSIYGENTLDPERAAYLIAGLHLYKNTKDFEDDPDNYNETDYIKLMAEEIEESEDKEIAFEEIISPSGKNYNKIQNLLYFEEVYIDLVQTMKKYK